LSLALWIPQVVLAAMFAAAGFMTLNPPQQKVAGRLPWGPYPWLSTITAAQHSISPRS